MTDNENNKVNISFFLQPKCNVAYIYSSDTFRQGLEKMDHYGYTAIPVLDDKERYVGTITEGDFLWSICSLKHGDISSIPARELEKYHVEDINFRRNYPSVRIDADMEEMVDRVMNQNFVPVVDDRSVFIGIITRKDVIKYFAEKSARNFTNEIKN